MRHSPVFKFLSCLANFAGVEWWGVHVDCSAQPPSYVHFPPGFIGRVSWERMKQFQKLMRLKVIAHILIILPTDFAATNKFDATGSHCHVPREPI